MKQFFEFLVPKKESIIHIFRVSYDLIFVSHFLSIQVEEFKFFRLKYVEFINLRYLIFCRNLKGPRMVRQRKFVVRIMFFAITCNGRVIIGSSGDVVTICNGIEA